MVTLPVTTAKAGSTTTDVEAAALAVGAGQATKTKNDLFLTREHQPKRAHHDGDKVTAQSAKKSLTLPEQK